MTVTKALAILANIEKEIRQVNAELAAAPAPTVKVKPGDSSMQKAIDGVAPGTTILAAPGVYDGIVLRGRVANITIKPDTTNLPPAGARIDPSFLPALVQLKPNAGGIGTNIVTDPGAEGYTLIGCSAIAGRPDVAMVYLGDDTSADPAKLPGNITLDRCLILADPHNGGKRGVMANTRAFAMLGCYTDDFWWSDDSQAVGGWNGPGPFRIENNRLCSTGENVIFGGADARSDAVHPANLTMRGNLLTKKLEWKDAAGHTVKNLFELKAMRGALIEGNIFENCWRSGQGGYGIVLTPRNQDGGAPFTDVRDVVFRKNVVRNCGAGINVLGQNDREPQFATGILRNVQFVDNLFYGIDGANGDGRLVQIVHGGQNIEVGRNTIVGARLNSFLDMDSQQIDGLNMHDNILDEGDYGLLYSGNGLGAPAWQLGVLNGQFTNNVIRRGPSGRTIAYPGSGNHVVGPETPVLNPDFTRAPAVTAGVDVAMLKAFIQGLVL